MKVVSLYSGADNLGDGIFQAGHEVVLAVEYNPIKPSLGADACETIKLNHPDCEVINKPVSEIISTLPKCDALVGGPPCPDFSNAKSDKDVEAGMCEVRNFIKAIDITKCKYHFMENVSGLYRHYKGRNFLINCADYGVPQTRERRIFTNLSLPQYTHAEFPSDTLFGKPLQKWINIKDALGLDGIIEDRKTIFGEKYKKEDGKFRQYSTDKPSNTVVIDSRQWVVLNKTIPKWKDKIILDDINKSSRTIICDKSDNGLWFVSPTGFDNKNQKQISRGIDEPMMTIVNANGYEFTDKPKMSSKYKQFQNDYKIERKLTNEELAILQGFRKDFKFYGSKTSVRIQIGNALPAAISKAFFLHET